MLEQQSQNRSILQNAEGYLLLMVVLVIHVMFLWTFWCTDLLCCCSLSCLLSVVDAFMDNEIAEYELGKRHLANIMGQDPQLFDQEDINVCCSANFTF